MQKVLSVWAARLLPFFIIMPTYSGDAQVERIEGNTQILQVASPEITELFRQLFGHMENIIEGTQIHINQTSLSRSLREVSQGIKDFHYPVICSPLGDEAQKYLRLSSETLGTTTFLIVSNANTLISKSDLLLAKYHLNSKKIRALSTQFSLEDKNLLLKKRFEPMQRDEYLKQVRNLLGKELNNDQIGELERAAYPYKLVIDKPHRNIIDAPSTNSNLTINSLRMVASGRADALIQATTAVYAMNASLKDKSLIQSLNLQIYEQFPVCAVVARNIHGGKTDRILNRVFIKLKEDPRYSSVIKEITERENIAINKLNIIEPKN